MKSEQRANQKRIREFEKELNRKEKALAETAALLVFEKKIGGAQDGPRDRMISIPDRRETITLTKKARQSGACLERDKRESDCWFFMPPQL